MRELLVQTGGVSIRAPLTRAGRQPQPRRGLERFAVSIRAPLTRAGRHKAAQALAHTYNVSIRAPLTRAGRRGEYHVVTADSKFQSAPRSRERGDQNVSAVSLMARWFQSAPRSRERGDWRGVHHVGGASSGFNPRPAHASGATPTGFGSSFSEYVSIRAPLTRAGRQHFFLSLFRSSGFQSAPRSRERGDSLERMKRQVTSEFQSAPRSRERGDTEAPARKRAYSMFQSAPRSRERGDQAIKCGGACSARVSIRAPLTRAGRLRVFRPTGTPLLFQSAPRSRERGDARAGRCRLD